MTTRVVGRNATPRALDHASTLDIDGKTVVYDERGHAMFVLNPSAGAVWRACDGTRTFDDVVRELAATHGTEPDAIAEDVRQTVDKLVSLGVLSEERQAPQG
jgi:hypothetical protein